MVNILDRETVAWRPCAVLSVCIFFLSSGVREECPDSVDFHNKAHINLCRALGFLYPVIDQNKPCLPLWGGEINNVAKIF